MRLITTNLIICLLVFAPRLVQAQAPNPADATILAISEGIARFVGELFSIFARLTGILAVLFVVVGGLMYVAGNAEGGKRVISWALIGLAIAMLSLIIVSFVSSKILGIPIEPGQVLFPRS